MRPWLAKLRQGVADLGALLSSRLVSRPQDRAAGQPPVPPDQPTETQPGAGQPGVGQPGAGQPGGLNRDTGPGRLGGWLGLPALPARLRSWRLPAGLGFSTLLAGLRPLRLPGGLRPPRLPGGLRPPRLPGGLRPPRLPGGVRPWIICLSLGFVLAALLSHGHQLLQLTLDLQGWLWLLVGVGLNVLSVVVNGLAWGVILRWRGLQPRWIAVVSLYVSTNLRKFLPGGIWHLAARVQALRSPEAPLAAPTGTAMALVVTLLDPLLAATAALALVPLGGWQNGLAPLTLLPLLLLLPRWLNPLLRRLERQRAQQLGLSAELDQELARGDDRLRRYPWQPLLAELAFVLLRFAGFYCCVWAFDLQGTVEPATWLAGFALAWTVGLVVPGAPGGLGVFEAVLLLRLGVALPEAPLLAVALSYRLMVTLAELLAAGLVAADDQLARRLQRASAPPLSPPEPPANSGSSSQ
ncbi:MAG: lysylphosphatidylglycerol synthase domain-containing protein [Cyanobium sp.]